MSSSRAQGKRPQVEEDDNDVITLGGMKKWKQGLGGLFYDVLLANQFELKGQMDTLKVQGDRIEKNLSALTEM